VCFDVGEQFGRFVFDVGHDEGSSGSRLEDAAGQFEQFGRGLGHGARGGGGHERDGLACFDIQAEEGLGGFYGFVPVFVAGAPALFGPMRLNRYATGPTGVKFFLEAPIPPSPAPRFAR